MQSDLNEQFVDKVSATANQTLKNAEYFYQVTFCQTKYCHRFVNFEVLPEIDSQFQLAIDQYITALKRIEGNALLLTKLQEISSDQVE